MAQLTPIKLGPDAGFTDLDAQLVAVAGGGDSFYWTGREFVVINNQNAGTCTVTFTAQADNFGITNAVHNATLAILTTKRGIFGAVSGFRFRDGNGLIQLSYSLSATVTIGVFVLATTA
jgi:hypothetical protein